MPKWIDKLTISCFTIWPFIFVCMFVCACVCNVVACMYTGVHAHTYVCRAQGRGWMSSIILHLIFDKLSQ